MGNAEVFTDAVSGSQGQQVLLGAYKHSQKGHAAVFASIYVYCIIELQGVVSHKHNDCNIKSAE